MMLTTRLAASMISMVVVASAPLVAHAALTPLPGSTPQTTLLGEPAPNPVLLLVTDPNGAPVPEAAVFLYQRPFEQAIGFTGWTSCTIDLGTTCTAKAGQDGIVRLTGYVGQPGTFSAQFTSSYGSAVIELTGVAGGPVAQLELLEGDGQRVVLGSTSAPIRLRFHRNGTPLVGQAITLSATGGPSFDYAEAQTDANGVASITLRPNLGYGTATPFLVAYDRLTATTLSVRVNITVTTASGATSFPIAPLWWAGEQQSGWGMAIAQRDSSVFAVVFLYDQDGRPTWVIPESSKWQAGFGSYIAADSLKTTAAPWFAYDASRFAATADLGRFIVNFNDQPPGRSYLRMGTSFAQVQTPMFAIDFSPAIPRPEKGVGDIWWGGPAQSGWGIAIAEQQGNLFLIWFTYREDGKPVWFVMSSGQWFDEKTWSGQVFETRGSPITVAHPYDASAFQATAIGTFTVRFEDDDHATFVYAIGSRSGTLALERFDY